MAEMGTRETEQSKTISDGERDRRVAAVNYARASGLGGFSLSAQMKHTHNALSTGKSASTSL